MAAILLFFVPLVGPVAAGEAQKQEPIVYRMFLFQGIREADPAGLKEAEMYPLSSRSETAGIKPLIKGPENALTAAIIEGLFEIYRLSAVDELFFHEAAWDKKKPSEDMITGAEAAYQIRLEARPTPETVKTKIKKYKVSASKIPYGDATLFDGEIHLILDEPILAAIPNPDGDLFMILWVSAGAPAERRMSPPPEKIYFVTPPHPIRQVRPSYPEELRLRGAAGRIGLLLTIDPQGGVVRVDVERPVQAYLDYAAVKAFRQWTFEPVLIKAKPVKAAFRWDYDFNPRLDERESPKFSEPSAAPAPQGELAALLARAAAYCEKLAAILSGYICEESIQETHFDLVNSRRWSMLVVGTRPSLSESERAEQERLADRDRISQGMIADDRIGQGRILFTQAFQSFDPQRDKRVKYVCDYQIFKKDNVISEQRIVLRENGKKPAEAKKTLRDRRFSALASFYAPLRVLAADRQAKFAYWLAGEEKIAGRKAARLSIKPRAEDQDGIREAQVWLDRETGQVLKCEIEGIPLDGQEDILRECVKLNIQAQFLTTHEYKAEKSGILFPWRSEVLAAYPGLDPRGPSPRLKISMAYDKYKFFSVETEHEVIRGPLP
jgi:TonB family protein